MLGSVVEGWLKVKGDLFLCCSIRFAWREQGRNEFHKNLHLLHARGKQRRIEALSDARVMSNICKHQCFQTKYNITIFDPGVLKRHYAYV